MKVRMLPAFLICAAAAAAASEKAVDEDLRFRMQGYAGQFQEHCMQLEAGQSLEYSVESPHPVGFNIHHHAGGKTSFLVDERIDSIAPPAIEIPASGQYCFEIKNLDNRPDPFDIRLRYRSHSG